MNSNVQVKKKLLEWQIIGSVAVVAAQLDEQPLPTQAIDSSNPSNSEVSTFSLNREDKIKGKRGRE